MTEYINEFFITVLYIWKLEKVRLIVVVNLKSIIETKFC